MAFALSQILVIGVEGFNKDDSVELWNNYYDNFVRNAFGSYRSVLWEVAHSPIMAAYLTYHGNRALAVAGTNADENFAREIMQLFSVRLGLGTHLLPPAPLLHALLHTLLLRCRRWASSCSPLICLDLP